MANSPVINLPALVVAMDWPYTVMVQEGKAPSECVFTTFVNASIALCDGLDVSQPFSLRTNDSWVDANILDFLKQIITD